MFEVRVFCEDSKLQKVMWALDGIVVGMPQVIPVRGAEPSKDKKKVVATITRDGASMVDKFSAGLLATTGDEITTRELIEIGLKAGSKNEQSAGSAIHYLVKRGLLKSIEKGRYKIIRN